MDGVACDVCVSVVCGCGPFQSNIEAPALSSKSSTFTQISYTPESSLSDTRMNRMLSLSELRIITLLVSRGSPDLLHQHGLGEGEGGAAAAGVQGHHTDLQTVPGGLVLDNVAAGLLQILIDSFPSKAEQDLLPSLQTSMVYPSRPESPITSGWLHMIVTVVSFLSSINRSRGMLVGSANQRRASGSSSAAGGAADITGVGGLGSSAGGAAAAASPSARAASAGAASPSAGAGAASAGAASAGAASAGAASAAAGSAASSFLAGFAAFLMGAGLDGIGCPGLLEPMLGGGKWNSLAWSCWADGQGSVPLTHSTGSSHTAFCPWTCSVTTYHDGLAVHVEGHHDAVGDLAGAAVHQVLSQPGGQVALTRPARPREDEAAVFEQQTDVVLHHGFGNEGFENKAVHTLLLQT
ncbi:hypothetical protein F7725_017386 [Dissostichus mawsoni]|uniref:Uncharacterized protein n=1 Tax=Dissostichus mawsoni TaxID=36200 RepID=A0A7J5Z565_DISMA|nr:hypothetical protein F7725_017386 [Dissostichus mawsoni]